MLLFYIFDISVVCLWFVLVLKLDSIFRYLYASFELIVLQACFSGWYEIIFL